MKAEDRLENVNCKCGTINIGGVEFKLTKPVDLYYVRKELFSFVEYIEFTSADEFKKFKNKPPITKEEIDNCDWDELGRKLAPKRREL